MFHMIETFINDLEEKGEVIRKEGTSQRVSLRGISKYYGNRAVIRDVSFAIRQGEILALLGPSGSGKTTILRLIAGFEQLDKGEIYIQQKLMAGLHVSIAPERRSVGMMFQDYALFPHMTVVKNVVYGLKGMERRRQEKVLEGMLALVGMEGYGDRYPHQLSGGEQQRIALARALAPCPAALLLDEPFSNLDADMRSRMRLEVLSILQRANTTTIIVTHDQEEAFTLADRVGVLKEGRLEQLDTPENIYHKPRTPFVARFVGQADFLKAVAGNDRVETELGHFSVEEPIPDLRFRVMIRPDDIGFTPDEQGEAEIIGREFLGSENLYSIRLRSGQMVRSSRPSMDIYRVGQKVSVQANLDHVVIFPSEEFEQEQL
jgi:iron(III) transport system ATP-binding protein